MINVQRLTKRHGATLAVDDLTFRVNPGLVTGFVGPNGAGKSTTMRAMLGLETPSDGKVTIVGKQYAELTEPLRVVGSLLDGSPYHPGRSAWNHLACLAISNGLSSRHMSGVLEQTGLIDVARRRVGSFSLGMKQRLGLAAALLGDPQVLVLDEPTNGLDPEGMSWLRAWLKTLAAEGRTVFVASHVLTEMALTADHLILIGRGRLLADVSVKDFIASASRSSGADRTLEEAYLLLARDSTEYGAGSPSTGTAS